MKQHGIVAAIVIFALIIVGMFTFAFLKKSEINSEVPTPSLPADTTTPYDNITRIDAKHFFINGTHTLVGEILMPTPCDLLNWESMVAESLPEQVTVAYSVVNNTESCIQTITPQRFVVTFSASAGAGIKATLNGRAVELNLVPPAPGETPENYEFSPKG